MSLRVSCFRSRTLSLAVASSIRCLACIGKEHAVYGEKVGHGFTSFVHGLDFGLSSKKIPVHIGTGILPGFI